MWLNCNLLLILTVDFVYHVMIILCRSYSKSTSYDGSFKLSGRRRSNGSSRSSADSTDMVRKMNRHSLQFLFRQSLIFKTFSYGKEESFSEHARRFSAIDCGEVVGFKVGLKRIRMFPLLINTSVFFNTPTFPIFLLLLNVAFAYWYLEIHSSPDLIRAQRLLIFENLT